MAFEVFESQRDGLSRGRARLERTGRARFSLGDLKAAGIDRAATILIDRKAKRIGIRAPRECEAPRVIRTFGRSANPNIWLSGAMLEIGIRPSEVAGQHEIAIEDGAIILDFGE